MGLPQCNTTLEDMMINEVSLFDSHDVTFHRLIEIISAACGLIAIVISLFLMFMHATHYSRPTEQRHIIRILFMVPVYALVSYLSIVYYYHSVYYEVLRDCYEAFAIASFFSLICAYVGDDLHQQKEYFRKISPKPWIWPMKWFQKCTGGERGALRTPRSGLTWFNVIFVAVFNYCFIRVSMTITAVITQYYDRYCLESLNPAFAHVWVMVIEAVAVTITMYCIIQFYLQLRMDIVQHKPILKVLAIKLVIFLSFWQTIIISFLTSSGAIQSSNKIQTPDIKVGIPCLLLCIEMAIFAVFHLWSFSYKPYVLGSQRNQQVYGHLNEKDPRYHGGPLGIKALGQSFNPWDLIKAVGRSAKWLFRDRRNRMNDVSYVSIDATTAHHQKLDDLTAVHTTYDAAADRPHDTALNGEDHHSGLLKSTHPPARQEPYATNGSESSTNTAWTATEAREYLQDQKMRQNIPDQQPDRFPRPAGTNPYGEQQQVPLPPPQHMPVVTKRDIDDMQASRQEGIQPLNPNLRPRNNNDGGFI